MWEQGLNYDQGGGFYGGDNQGGQNTPSTGEKRRQRAQNLVPVKIGEILDNREETFKVEGMEVGMVAVVGIVDSVDHQATKSIYFVRDDSGRIEAMQWKDENASAGEDIEENSYIRIVGSVRSQGDKKHIMVFRALRVSGDEEIDAHSLEVEHAKLKIRQMTDKENSRIGVNTSSIGGGIGFGQTQMSTSFSGASQSATLISGLTSNQDIVYRMLRGCLQEEGLSRDELFKQVGGRMSRHDMDNALEHLSNEGHIYSTTDDNHFKSTDG